jgi:MCP family monocarboxylic acid transporter-like MFS transporter 10
MFGAGASLVYTPSLTILGHYFKRRMGLVNGIVTAGSSLFTIGLGFINEYILTHHGLEPCLQMFSCLAALLIPCSLTFLPLLPPQPCPVPPGSSACRRLLEKVVYLKNWRNKRFVIWTLAIPLALFGYFVPYVHLVTID